MCGSNLVSMPLGGGGGGGADWSECVTTYRVSLQSSANVDFHITEKQGLLVLA